MAWIQRAGIVITCYEGEKILKTLLCRDAADTTDPDRAAWDLPRGEVGRAGFAAAATALVNSSLQFAGSGLATEDMLTPVHSAGLVMPSMMIFHLHIFGEVLPEISGTGTLGHLAFQWFDVRSLPMFSGPGVRRSVKNSRIIMDKRNVRGLRLT
jgi:hypothetical protein